MTSIATSNMQRNDVNDDYVQLAIREKLLEASASQRKSFRSLSARGYGFTLSSDGEIVHPGRDRARLVQLYRRHLIDVDPEIDARITLCSYSVRNDYSQLVLRASVEQLGACFRLLVLNPRIHEVNDLRQLIGAKLIKIKMTADVIRSSDRDKFDTTICEQLVLDNDTEGMDPSMARLHEKSMSRSKRKRVTIWSPSERELMHVNDPLVSVIGKSSDKLIRVEDILASSAAAHE